jgi:hypothetical protein
MQAELEALPSSRLGCIIDNLDSFFTAAVLLQDFI